MAHQNYPLRSRPGLCFLAAFLGTLLFSAGALDASPAFLLSERDPSSAFPTAANGDSEAAWISRDGRFILFRSLANDLVTNRIGPFGVNVFLHDRADNTTVLVSANSDGEGARGTSTCSQLSTNGRYAAFESDATDLLPGDTNEVSDIFVRDLQSRISILVSVATNGGWPNGESSEPVMTPDGGRVAFVSKANNLVSGDTNGIPDIFVRDLIAGTTTLISVGATGVNSIVTAPLISSDGRYVAFSSTANGMATGVPATSKGEIYLYDLALSKMTWASTNAAATVSTVLKLASMPSYHPRLSDDGRFVAFKTGWTNGAIAPLAPGVPAAIVFCYDALNATSTIVSTNSFPPWAYNDDAYGPEMTPDGRFIAYAEREKGSNPTNSSIRVWDRQTGTNALASAAPDGSSPTNAISDAPALSADGRFVTFMSNATNLVANLISNSWPHIYRRDLQTSTTLLLDTDANDPLDTVPSLNADGTSVVFSSGGALAGLLNDRNNSEVILWDAIAGTNQLISKLDPRTFFRTANGMGSLGQMTVDDDGESVAFTSYASDMVTNDFNGYGDVFVRDLMNRSNQLVSVGIDGNAALGGTSANPILSANGRFVTFTSYATNLVPNITYITNSARRIFRRDLQTGTTELASVNSNGTPVGNGDSYSPVTSQDGRYVAFFSRTNKASGQAAVFWRDVDSGLTVLVSSNAYSLRDDRPLSLSADGQRLAYWTASQTVLYVWDAGSQTNLCTITTTAFAPFISALLSPSGNRLFYQTLSQAYIRDLSDGSDLVLATGAINQNPSSWSQNARYLAFVTTASLVSGDSNGVSDVYLKDLQAGTLTLLSMNQSGTASGNAASDWPVISADGRLVVFRTMATNIVPGIVKPPALVVYNCSSGSNSLLVSGMRLPTWLSSPTLSANGARIAFQSWDSGLVTGDLNLVGDTFAGDLSLIAAPDSDGDGIPDWWTLQYFGHAAGEAGDLSRAGDDADGDGINNLDEFLAGTNPGSASSLLRVHITADSASSASLSWEANPGRTYQVFCTTNLNNSAWETFPASVTMDGSQGKVILPHSDSQRYFRVRCDE